MSAMYPEALIIEPMKINKIPEGKEHMFPSICASGDYFAQLKKDGYWYMFEKTEHYSYLFSRTTSAVSGTLAEKSANVPHIMEIMNHLPENTIIIGEIYYPGKSSKDVTPIMGSLPEKAIERQNGSYGFLHYYIHDIIRFKNKDLIKYGASIRYNLLKEIYNRYLLNYSSINGETIVELAERVDDNIQEFVADALNRGEEGAVLKKKTAPYTPGKRPAWDTIKIKKTDTCDAICLGFCKPTKYYDGKLDVGPNYTGADAEKWPYWVIEQRNFPDINGVIIHEECVPVGDYTVIRSPAFSTHPVTKAYYYGWVNSMRVGAYDDDGNIVEIGTISSGMTEEFQYNASKNPDNYIGKVVKLAGMEKNHKDKTLRHFFFKGFHEDKDKKDCKISEIF